MKTRAAKRPRPKPCPVCFDPILPPVLQCQSGHLLCSECDARLQPRNCPVCRVDLPTPPIRNREIEEVWAACTLGCRHCRAPFEHAGMPSHLAECEEAPRYWCPCCPETHMAWRQLVLHLREQHSELLMTLSLDGKDWHQWRVKGDALLIIDSMVVCSDHDPFGIGAYIGFVVVWLGEREQLPDWSLKIGSHVLGGRALPRSVLERPKKPRHVWLDANLLGPSLAYKPLHDLEVDGPLSYSLEIKET